MNYFRLIEKLDQIINFHSRIKRSNPTYYKMRAMESLDEYSLMVPVNAPDEFVQHISYATYLHKEVMAKGYCACRTHWQSIDDHLKKARFSLQSWIEARRINPETSKFEKTMIELATKLTDDGEPPIQALLESPTAIVKRVPTVSGVTEQDITEAKENKRETDEILAKIYGHPITEKPVVEPDASKFIDQEADDVLEKYLDKIDPDVKP